jgi:hypothetical protein
MTQVNSAFSFTLLNEAVFLPLDSRLAGSVPAEAIHF